MAPLLIQHVQHVESASNEPPAVFQYRLHTFVAQTFTDWHDTIRHVGTVCVQFERKGTGEKL